MKTLKYKVNDKFEPLYEVYKEESSKVIYTTHEDVGKVCLVNNNTSEKIIVSVDDLEQYKDTYTPIGVVVIPASHDVYGTGEGAIMSLAAMNCKTPDTGAATETAIYWGQYKTDITELKIFDQVNIVSNATDNVLSDVNSYGYLPSTNFTETLSADGLAYYNQTSNLTPSPYLPNGSRNPVYYSIEKSEFNALSDFNGMGNSQVLLDLATEQTDWKTAANIENQSGAGYSPAACCCWRFHTDFTNQGDWYLPAMGELGYIMARLKEINSAIERVNIVYNADSTNIVACQVGINSFWASSEYSIKDARGLNTYNGLVYNNTDKNANCRVRAFLHI